MNNRECSCRHTIPMMISIIDFLRTADSYRKKLMRKRYLYVKGVKAMTEETLRRCENLVHNRNIIKKAYFGCDSMSALSGALIFNIKNLEADEGTLHRCEELLKKNVSLFSYFRGNAVYMVLASLAASDDPEGFMQNSKLAYQTLKKRFMSTQYLPIAAMILAGQTKPCQYEEYADRARTIYEKAYRKHPFLTSGEDYAACVLLALLNKPVDSVMQDTEDCYQLLRKDFFSANSVQALAFVLAMHEGTPMNKYERTLHLFRCLKEQGRKYGTSYELATLGMLAMSTEDERALAQEIIEIDTWLAAQQGFGFWSSISPTYRLMGASIIAVQGHAKEDASISGSMLAVIATQEIAVIMALVSSSEAAAAMASINNINC